MQIDTPQYADGIIKGKQTKFSGFNMGAGAGDGEICAMRNLTSDHYPLLATRDRRKILRRLEKPNGIFAWDKLCWVDGTCFYYDGEEKGTVTDGKKTFAAINDMIIILPDKKVYNTIEDSFGSLEAEVGAQEAGEPVSLSTAPQETETISAQEVTETDENEEETTSYPPVIFRDGALDGKEVKANVIYCKGINWEDYVSPGDTITILDNVMDTDEESDESEEESEEEETPPPDNNGTFLIREVEGHELRFDADSFVLGTDSSTEAYAQGETGIHFEVTHPSAAVFTADSLICRLQEGDSWEDSFTPGELLTISGCSAEGNNRSVVLQEIDGDTLRFDDGSLGTSSLTPTADADGVTITREHAHPIVFRDGTIYGEEALANTIYCNCITWSEYFREGDAVTISGCSIEANNQTLIIRELDGNEMRFYENSFTTGYDAGTEIQIKRSLPDLAFAFENENRLWGCVGNTIYASKLGDPYNFNVYDGLDTDSFAVDTGSRGDFTGGISYLGYPTFFKEDNIYKVYGSRPSNYELMSSATLGLAEGSGGSLAIAGETLFYLHRSGVCMFSGGIPSTVSRAFGARRYRNACGGSDGIKYYVSMQDTEDGWHLFVYDTQKGLWHEEDETQAVGFAELKGVLYALESGGEIRILRSFTDCPEADEEEAFDWSAEFTDFVDDSPNKKDLRKLQIRLDLEENASVKFWVQMDSSGEWVMPQGGEIREKGKRSYWLAIVPTRADHYRIKLTGHGGCKVYSISRDYSQGSEFRSQVGRN